MALDPRGGYTCRRVGARPGARSDDGAAPVRVARSVRAAQRYSGPAQHIVQRCRRTDRESRARRVFNVPAMRNRSARRRFRRGHKARGLAADAARTGDRMLTRRGGIRRRLIMVASAGGSIVDLARGLWRSDSGKRWLVPLAVFMCLFGVILIL